MSAPRIHLQHQRSSVSACGHSGCKTTLIETEVTCAKCKRIAGLGTTWAQARQLGPRKPAIRAETSTRALDAVLGRHGPPVEYAHADDIAIDAFALAMKQRMRAKRGEGRSGWNDPKRCSAAKLTGAMRRHARLCDFLDTAIYGMMLYTRGGR